MILLKQLLESLDKKLPAIIYGGRFQPFHKGHYSVYNSLCKEFGEGSVWIATSNKTNFDPKNGDISPFTFDERKEIMTQMFGISPDKIIQCKNPTFTPFEIIEQYKTPVVCVLVCGDKDSKRYSDADNYERFPKNGKIQNLKTVTGDKISYYLINNSKDGDQSGTSIRESFKKAGDNISTQQKLFKKYYGKADDEIMDLIISKIKMIKNDTI